MISLDFSSKLTACISQASDGNLDLRYGKPNKVIKNLKHCLDSAGLDLENIVEMEQTHKTKVKSVSYQHKSTIIKDTDGLLTDQSKTLLMLKVADCIPILIHDPEKEVIALVHCGFRGAIGKIQLVALQALQRDYGSKPQNLKVFFGPSLQPCCNLLSEPPLQTLLPEWKAYLIKNPRGYQINLPGFVSQSLLQAGITKRNLMLSDQCTYHHPGFFSHKKFKENNLPELRFAVFLQIN